MFLESSRPPDSTLTSCPFPSTTLFGSVVTFITLCGIASLTGYWVAKRTRQIGIRRALGATRGQILRYFQVENLILTSIAVLVGMPLAYAINLWLMQHYELARLPGYCLPVGVLALCLLGQLAVYGPARRAAAEIGRAHV